MATETKTEVTYITDRPGLKLIIENADVLRNERGTIVKTIPPVHVLFPGGRADLAIDKKGRTTCNGRVLPIEFDELIDRLEERDDNPTLFERMPEPPKRTAADLARAEKQAAEIRAELEADAAEAEAASDDGGGKVAANGNAG